MNQHAAYHVLLHGGLDPYGLWVWPWDENASWDPRATARLWGRGAKRSVEVTGMFVTEANDAYGVTDALEGASAITAAVLTTSPIITVDVLASEVVVVGEDTVESLKQKSDEVRTTYKNHGLLPSIAEATFMMQLPEAVYNVDVNDQRRIGDAWDRVLHGTVGVQGTLGTAAGFGGTLTAIQRACSIIVIKAKTRPRVVPSVIPKPPAWTPDSGWEYRGATRKWQDKSWWDPDGGEWRYNPPDAHHALGHWDYNPWTTWSSSWQNIYPRWGIALLKGPKGKIIVKSRTEK